MLSVSFCGLVEGTARDGHGDVRKSACPKRPCRALKSSPNRFSEGY